MYSGYRKKKVQSNSQVFHALSFCAFVRFIRCVIRGEVWEWKGKGEQAVQSVGFFGVCSHASSCPL